MNAALTNGQLLAMQGTLVAFLVATVAGLLKWMVQDKLKGIKEALEELKQTSQSQDERLREVELDLAELRGQLGASGCLGPEWDGHERRVVDGRRR